MPQFSVYNRAATAANFPKFILPNYMNTVYLQTHKKVHREREIQSQFVNAN